MRETLSTPWGRRSAAARMEATKLYPPLPRHREGCTSYGISPGFIAIAPRSSTPSGENTRTPPRSQLRQRACEARLAFR